MARVMASGADKDGPPMRRQRVGSVARGEFAVRIGRVYAGAGQSRRCCVDWDASSGCRPGMLHSRSRLVSVAALWPPTVSARLRRRTPPSSEHLSYTPRSLSFGGRCRDHADQYRIVTTPSATKHQPTSADRRYQLSVILGWKREAIIDRPAANDASAEPLVLEFLEWPSIRAQLRTAIYSDRAAGAPFWAIARRKPWTCIPVHIWPFASRSRRCWYVSRWR